MGFLQRAPAGPSLQRDEGPRRSSQVQTSGVSRLCKNCEIASTCSVMSVLRDKSAGWLAWNRCQTYNSGLFDNACCKHLSCSGDWESIFVRLGHINNGASPRLQATCRTAL